MFIGFKNRIFFILSILFILSSCGGKNTDPQTDSSTDSTVETFPTDIKQSEDFSSSDTVVLKDIQQGSDQTADAPCLPKTCQALGKECGFWDNECGAAIHCGDCNYFNGLDCDKGTCICFVSTKTNCFGVCVDISTDNNNCGVCGQACQINEICNNGICECNCAYSLVTCPGMTPPCTCIDLLTDPDHCGLCNNPCVSPKTCFNGMCS